MSSDGSGQARITSGSIDESPSWSPDGMKITFSRRSNYIDPGDIYVMNADGSGQTNLTNESAYDENPDWSPDGSKIVYARTTPTGYFDIFVMNADGTDQRNLTDQPQSENQPRWSPDGTKIAYTDAACCGDRGDLHMMNADGSGAWNVTHDLPEDSSPSWSADSSKIAFTRWNNGDYELFITNADGSARWNLTNTSYVHEGEPDWSRDGTKIAYVSGPLFKLLSLEIFRMNADGSGQTDLTNSPWTDDVDPSWGTARRPNRVCEPADAECGTVRAWRRLFPHLRDECRRERADSADQRLRRRPLPRLVAGRAEAPFLPRRLAGFGDLRHERGWQRLDLSRRRRRAGLVSRRLADCLRIGRGLCHERRRERPDQPDRRVWRVLLAGLVPRRLTHRFPLAPFRAHPISGFDVMDADGSNRTQLPFGGGNPAWSPDGTTIAVSGGGPIFLMNDDGTNPIDLSNYRFANDASPDWSPDGGSIAFDSYRVPDGPPHPLPSATPGAKRYAAGSLPPPATSRE